MHSAVVGENVEVISTLYSSGADVNQTDAQRRTPLMYVVSCVRRHQAVSQLLSQSLVVVVVVTTTTTTTTADSCSSCSHCCRSCCCCNTVRVTLGSLLLNNECVSAVFKSVSFCHCEQ